MKDGWKKYIHLQGSTLMVALGCHLYEFGSQGQPLIKIISGLNLMLELLTDQDSTLN